MASIIFGVVVITYDTIAKAVRRRRATKAQKDVRFSELKRENAARIARLRDNCACGGDHLGEDHPGGPYLGGDPVIRNDHDGNRGFATYDAQHPDGGLTGKEEEPPPGYEDVVAGSRGGCYHTQ